MTVSPRCSLRSSSGVRGAPPSERIAAPDELGEEADVLAAGGERLQRCKTGGVAQLEISAAEAVAEDLEATVLVPEHYRRPEPLRLRHQERHQRRLTRARGATDEGVADIPDMEVVEERLAGDGPEHRAGRAPVSLPLASRIGVHRRHGAEIE